MTYYKAAKQYLRAVGRHLVCSKENHARLMKLTSRAVNAFLDDDPDKPYSALVSAIGEPKAFAESLLAGIPIEEVKRARKKRRLLFSSALVSVTLVVAAAFTALAGFYFKYQEAERDGAYVTIVSVQIPEGMTIDQMIELDEYRYHKMLEAEGDK